MQRQLSETEKHGVATGETVRPLELARIDLGPIYERAQGQPEYEPGQVLAGDTLVARGTGRYHADKRRGAMK